LPEAAGLCERAHRHVIPGRRLADCSRDLQITGDLSITPAARDHTLRNIKAAARLRSQGVSQSQNSGGAENDEQQTKLTTSHSHWLHARSFRHGLCFCNF